MPTNMNNAKWTIEVVPAHTDDLIGLFSSKVINAPEKVYITHLEDTDYTSVIDCAKTLQQHGISAVPHLGVRNLPASVDVRLLADQLKAAGINEVLLLGGNSAKPRGRYSSVIEALKTGVFDTGFERLHFAGFPEPNPAVKDMAVTYEALADKFEYVTNKGIASRTVSQFCFNGATIIDYLAQLESLQISGEKYIGLSAPVSITKLIKFSMMCGVGNSIKFLEKNASKLGGLTSSIFGKYDSSALVDQLMQSGHQIDGFHVFAFGNYQGAFDVFQNDKF